MQFNKSAYYTRRKNLRQVAKLKCIYIYKRKLGRYSYNNHLCKAYSFYSKTSPRRIVHRKVFIRSFIWCLRRYLLILNTRTYVLFIETHARTPQQTVVIRTFIARSIFLPRIEFFSRFPTRSVDISRSCFFYLFDYFSGFCRLYTTRLRCIGKIKILLRITLILCNILQRFRII